MEVPSLTVELRGNLVGSLLPECGGFVHQTHVIILNGKHFYLLSLLVWPSNSIFGEYETDKAFFYIKCVEISHTILDTQLLF